MLLEGDEAVASIAHDAAALEENKQSEILEMLKRFRFLSFDKKK